MAKASPATCSAAGSPHRRAAISVRLSDLGMPIAHDGLVVGREAPVGPAAVASALEALAPGVYEVVPLSHGQVSAVAVRKELMKAIPREMLVKLLIDAFLQAGSDRSVARVRVKVSIEVTRIVEIA